MTGRTELKPLFEELDRRADLGDPLQLWLRDDDAVAPSEPLDRLLQLTNHHGVPTLLAVIPAFTGTELQQRLALEKGVEVAVHGWAHLNHAGAGEKSRELGMHRPLATVLDELARGRERLESLYETRFVPMLVPPWNRIDSDIIGELGGLGFEALSVYGPERSAPLTMLNTHVDIMDWRGTRGGRPLGAVVGDLVAMSRTHKGPVGLLTHHLVHDAAAWDLLELLFAATEKHAGCRWRSARDLLADKA
ncbi:polysaccharide deacetylase [Rhizobium sp. PDO1-076]|uniref:polysaccharide deacetylase family protein n=1 Tax=Rhizobium sp. PDO1-076 TaxID=1125979 RepID=UPI00024E2258|nr:polysaccharide deacetylase family protein [Rhizobium sp. PDO1-076]EHS49425.1 polysaccharide deacetylase [Rhizobium sp. PDO1-076]